MPRKGTNVRIAEFVGGPYSGQRREIPRSEGQDAWTDATVPALDFGGFYRRTNFQTEDHKALLWTWQPRHD